VPRRYSSADSSPREARERRPAGGGSPQVILAAADTWYNSRAGGRDASGLIVRTLATASSRPLPLDRRRRGRARGRAWLGSGLRRVGRGPENTRLGLSAHANVPRGRGNRFIASHCERLCIGRNCIGPLSRLIYAPYLLKGGK
jgi:hypothetical protein